MRGLDHDTLSRAPFLRPDSRCRCHGNEAWASGFLLPSPPPIHRPPPISIPRYLSPTRTDLATAGLVPRQYRFRATSLPPTRIDLVAADLVPPLLEERNLHGVAR